MSVRAICFCALFFKKFNKEDFFMKILIEAEKEMILHLMEF